ncbi:hypothetical protein MGYG_02963 [Nannizzia gypsea CBS 118893]|uniref:Uncharacterized protein n=1 Tax=Arthroderma gypseum (strain ATCC MYA-4604 / CBS 118893) TaxID=535722 RepID=E4UQ36_ARTGP|nr:hypothetical protein MGYG_02963 [Nannizzia gypsea CBS 118893]EFQ99955.1 hypothetical protein MGYG_02963 [Nannizzia gypsea CBS 118893]
MRGLQVEEARSQPFSPWEVLKLFWAEDKVNRWLSAIQDTTETPNNLLCLALHVHIYQGKASRKRWCWWGCGFMGCADWVLQRVVAMAGGAEPRDYTYKTDDEDDEWCLALCILLVAGMPFRGTELASLQAVNTGHTGRRVFIYDDTLLVICEYSKAENVSGHPVVVIRALPQYIARLFIMFLARIRPLIEFINFTI